MSSASARSTPANPTSERRPTTPSRPRSPTSQVPSPSTVRSGQGVIRSQSFRGASAISRAARNNSKRVGTAASNLSNVSDHASHDDAREETIAIVDELKESLRKAETASEEYQRQLSMAQTRLNDVHLEQAKLEDRLQESSEMIQKLEAEKKEASRRQRENESYYEAERTALVEEDAKQKVKHEESQATIRRLKETLAQRETRTIHDEGMLSRSSSCHSKASGDLEGTSFAPSSSLQRSDSNNNLRLGMQKDRTIESFKLDIAELQSKLVEVESTAGSRMHDLEKKLLESRTSNARLLEENESFQLLLSQKTLNGDFSKAEFMQDAYTKSSGLGSLAEELESIEGESENYRRLENEAKSLKDQNKALTLYIENIIGRLLQHKDFETFFEKTTDLMSGRPKAGTPREEKALPPPPPAKDEQEMPSILQRARTVVAGGRRSRPTSQMLQPSAVIQQPVTTPNEDINKAPSVPLTHPQPPRNESHRRSQSDMAFAAPLVNQMYRGPPLHGNVNPMSPGISPGITTPRTSYFNFTAISDNSKPTSRIPSSSQERNENIGSSSNSTFSDRSSDVDPSQPRTNSGAAHGGAVMTQSKLRPLRLVQENSNLEEEARKKANRGSWIPTGWFNRGKEEESPRNSSPSIKE